VDTTHNLSPPGAIPKTSASGGGSLKRTAATAAAASISAAAAAEAAGGTFYHEDSDAMSTSSKAKKPKKSKKNPILSANQYLDSLTEVEPKKTLRHAGITNVAGKLVEAKKLSSEQVDFIAELPGGGKMLQQLVHWKIILEAAFDEDEDDDDDEGDDDDEE